MSGDYSRFSFKHRKNYDGVLLQQGRPLSDWDWNDLVAELKRREQAGTLDVFGGVAVVPQSTPDGFKIASDANGRLKIGRGRLYVDGLLAENHGTGDLEWDPKLAEERGKEPVFYEDQPYLPNAPALPESGGPHVVYVDVWRREVTHIEAPDLVEKALGVDTTTRWQTVWQVKVLENAEGVAIDCETPDADVPGWTALTASSAGRLSTDTATFGSEDPCLIAASGGYNGLENQLYRVEIHDGGAPGTATFKWSRDDASIATRVTRLVGNPAKSVVVETVGKDGVLRFNDGDWVEITDDARELNGLPGELHRVVVGGGVDDATRTLTFETAITAGLFPVDANGKPDPDLHTRVRRWDQRGKVFRADTAAPTEYADLDAAGASGALTVPASGTVEIGLESGIVVRFDVDAPGGQFRSGDYWMFAARTADASIEILAKAPPHGVHHHYARIGLLTPEPEPCRTMWPPSFGGDRCACTICVSPGAHAEGSPSIQQAIEAVIAAGGGTVCLEVGTYPLREPLRIRKAHTLRLRGHGEATILRAKAEQEPTGAASAAGAIDIESSTDVVIEDLRIETTGRAATAIVVADSRDFTLRNVAVEMESRSESTAAVRLAGNLSALRFENNHVRCPLGIAGFEPRARRPLGTLQDLDVIDNFLSCRIAAVRLGPLNEAGRLCLNGNQVVGCAEVGLALSGGARPRGGLEIARNQLDVEGTAIAVGMGGMRIADNIVRNTREGRNDGRGVVLLQRPDGEESVGGCHVVANRISSFGAGAIAVEARLDKVQIKQNQIDLCGRGITMTDTGSVQDLAIDNNQISEIEGDPDQASRAEVSAIRVSAVQHLQITGNAIRDIGRFAGRQNFAVIGVVAQHCGSVQILGNQIVNIAPPEPFTGLAAGIAVADFGELDVSDNRIRRDDGTQKADRSAWSALLASDRTTALPRARIRSFAGLASEHSAFIQNIAKRLFGSRQRLADVAITQSRASIRGNQIAARGAVDAVRVIAETCDFNNNQCERVASDPLRPSVSLTAATLGAGGNRVSGDTREAVSMELVVPAGQRQVCAALGNVADGMIRLNGGPLPPPWTPLNIQGLG